MYNTLIDFSIAPFKEPFLTEYFIMLNFYFRAAQKATVGSAHRKNGIPINKQSM